VLILKGFKSFVLEVHIPMGLGVCFPEVRILKGLGEDLIGKQKKRRLDVGAIRQNVFLPAHHYSRNYGFVKKDFSNQKWRRVGGGSQNPQP
jgi:hypothetical protein